MPSEHGDTMTPQTIRYKGAVYRRALMLKRQPEFAPPAGAAPPGPPGPPDQDLYHKVKQCILAPVPGKEDVCDQLAVMEDIIEKAAIALKNFRQLLTTDDPAFLSVLQVIQTHMPTAKDQMDNLIFTSQVAHKALKELRRR